MFLKGAFAFFGVYAERMTNNGHSYFGAIKPRVAAYMGNLNDTLWNLGILPKLCQLRLPCDESETLTAKKYWPFPTYGNLLFSVH